MKKILALLLCLVMCVSLAPQTYAAETQEAEPEVALALQLKTLGLLEGVSSDPGAVDFELNRAPSRVEALVMLLRALGKGVDAKAYPKTHPFEDVPGWADGYVSYAWDKGLTDGVSETRFDPDSDVTAAMYLTFMLRALGYKDGSGGDFDWEMPFPLAAWCGLLTNGVHESAFLRADMVEVTCAALYAPVKGSKIPLHELLQTQGVFTAEQFAAAFPQDPFARFRQIDKQVSAAVATMEKLGMLTYNTCATEVHVITDLTEENGMLCVTGVVCFGSALLQKDNSFSSYGKTVEWMVVKLDAKTLELESSVLAEMTYPELKRHLPGALLTGFDVDIFRAMSRVADMDLRMKIAGGVIGYRQPSYEEALAYTSTRIIVKESLETGHCTILQGYMKGAMMGSFWSMYLVYKPGSIVGEGEVITLPLPTLTANGTVSPPDTFELSKDGLKLYYTEHFDDRSVIDAGLPSERLIHEAGTYNYTTDLATGVTTLVIVPD